ncbi:MAG: copper resistance protein CopC [Candidatus Nanopelagicaceae bacterium]|nr:copper resistance protein CopC [Candidatus Nanopelagicaceae bacterium]
MRLRKTLVGAVLVFIAFGSAWSASANSLVSATPIAGATLTSSPSAITMTTEVPLIDQGNTITVRDPQGTRVDDGTLTINGTDAVAGLKLLTVSGIYTVSYSLLTDNDIPLEGTYTFSFTAPSVISSPSPTVITPSASPGNSPNNSVGVPTLVIALILSAVAVFLSLCFYAWKLIFKR